MPCGYFLVNGLTGAEKANLTKECITKLHEVGVKVVSFTCDGPTSHQSMLKLLGAKLSPDDMQAYFLHPCDPNARINIFLDACHMIKFVRNTTSDWRVLHHKDRNITPSSSNLLCNSKNCRKLKDCISGPLISSGNHKKSGKLSGAGTQLEYCRCFGVL